ncbi:hypothetical protein V501_01627, partial [Pseudogymnoascus sp. VKM F-4519 (FW-2642)]
ASGTGLRREVEVGVDKSVVGVLYKGEPTLRVPQVVLDVSQVDDGIEIVHHLLTKLLGLGSEVLCQATEFMHREVELVPIGHGLPIVAPAEEERRGIRPSDHASKVPETLELL